ncbi:hypothetical protein DFJ73DRAFT_825711 [Zopfochytrium polystomum]|nr:hypothetical protein DFJ73DRAFT_825711 [Zopfochytrium polystomum]
MTSVRVSILTVSDRVSAGLAEDESGPALRQMIHEMTTNWGAPWTVVSELVVPDDIGEIQAVVRRWADATEADLILTTGGTGFGVRDVTPEAVSPLLEKQAPGLVAAMLKSSLGITPMAALARPVAGVRRRSIIITLPGSPKGAVENFEALRPCIQHAVDLARGDDAASTATHSQMAQVSTHGGSSSRRQNEHGHHHSHHHHHHQHHVPLRGEETGGSPGLQLLLNAPVAKRARKSPFPLVPVPDALKIVLDHAKPLQPTRVPVGCDLVGHVLAENVIARESVPSYRASIVDGYAVIASDGPGNYRLLARAVAGSAQSEESLKPATIARVTTGAPVPDGADAVVMVEDTELVESSADGEELQVRILTQATPNQNIRAVGSDVAIGETVAEKGFFISAPGGEVGLIASVGVREVSVHPLPKIAILSTGNELVPFDFPDLLTGASASVRDTNMPTLVSAIAATLPGTLVHQLPPARDEAALLTSAVREGLANADVLITTGGVSMGEADLLKPVLREIGARIHFGRVLMKPGKPTTFATWTDENGRVKLLFGLPGNPVSALVGFYVFVLPALKKLAGFHDCLPPKLKATIAHTIVKDPRPEFHRARVIIDEAGKGFIAHGTGSQLSSRLLSMKGANALLVIPPADESSSEIQQGAEVEAWLIGSL